MFPLSFQSKTTSNFLLNDIAFTKRRFGLTNTQKATIRQREGEPECSAALVFVAFVVSLFVVVFCLFFCSRSHFSSLGKAALITGAFFFISREIRRRRTVVLH